MRTRITLAIITGLVAPLAAQSAPATPVKAATATVATATAPAAPDVASGYTYHPEGRRDPFVSLMHRAPDVQLGSAGARAPGLAGLGVSEVTLKGTMQARDGYIAMVLGSDSRTYIVRPGDRLQDGTIRAITRDSLVIAQQVNDSPSSQKQREVRKMLRQTEEAK
jgi:Tfp pilus assembly protein PilP